MVKVQIDSARQLLEDLIELRGRIFSVTSHYLPVVQIPPLDTTPVARPPVSSPPFKHPWPHGG